MKIVLSIADLKTEVKIFKAHGLSIGFVPTMGALHAGHLALVRKSEAENDITIVSIFVNPTQFNDKKDFENYPNTLEEDKNLLYQEGTALLFYPKYNELYPDDYHYKVSEDSLSKILCGAHRPGHFDGVLTIVMKLLNLVQADRAYFGEKDFQQMQLVKGMTEAFFMPTHIVAMSTVREADGVAMSSRNRRLSSTEREQAKEFPKILALEGVSNTERKELLANKGFEVDYIEELNHRRFGAVKLGQVRLIDNVEVKNETQNSL